MITAPDGTPQAAVDQAEELVCGVLGLETLEVVERTEVIGCRGQLLHLSAPASAVLSVTHASSDVTGYSLLTPRAVSLPSLPYGPATVTYVTGWTEQTLPLAIKQAVLLTAQSGGGQAVPEGVTSIKLPEITLTFEAGMKNGTLPAAARALLGKWLAVRW